MIGLEFEIENKFDNYLYKILKNISTNNYVWKIIDDDAFCEKNMGFLFEKDEYNNDEFFELIKNIKSYIIFCTILLYKENVKSLKIETPKDFINSGCELILLITDNIFVEIYCKSEELEKQIRYNLFEMNIDFKEKNIFCRKKMNGRYD